MPPLPHRRFRKSFHGRSSPSLPRSVNRGSQAQPHHSRARFGRTKFQQYHYGWEHNWHSNKFFQLVRPRSRSLMEEQGFKIWAPLAPGTSYHWLRCTAPPPVVVNRFGDDDANGRPSVAPAVPVVPTTTTTTARPTTTAANQPLPPSPIVGLWNQLGTKIADTADAIAGMLKKTVDVLVTSHIQSHQRALRRIQ
uniref:Uncharacterized protein n=1 Tax=Anopheles melas TaxID=34690 RepID=A0A182TXJ9_9DIPT